MKSKLCIFALAVMLTAVGAAAQETTGGVIGTVVDQASVALPGAMVTLVNAVTGLERVEVTNTKGQFKFPALPPGSYEIAVKMEGFQEVKQTFSVSLGATRTVNVQLPPGTFAEVVTVTAEAPLVDTQSTVTGITVSADDLNKAVPIYREASSIAMMAPGTVYSDTAFTGSDYTPGQTVVSIEGASVAENSYQVNGLNITNFRNGLGGSFVPYEFMQEVQIKTGGYEAEFGRSTGGVINMVTKSGSNAFHGSLNAYYNPESLQENSPNTYDKLNQANEYKLLEANASVGGPLIKDHVFFYAFGTMRDSRVTDPTTESITIDDGKNDLYWGGKLDWNITASHRLEGTYFTDAVELDRTVDALNADASWGDEIGSGFVSRGGKNYIGKYTGLFGENFMVSAQYGFNQFDRTTGSPNDAICPYAYDSTYGGLTYVGCWVQYAGSAALDERNAYRLDFDFFTGNHSLRAGADYEANTSSDVTVYSGGVYYRYYASGTTLFPQLPAGTPVVRVQHYSSGGSFDVATNAAYIQDSWRVSPKVTLNLGVRWEQFDNKNALGESFIKITDQYAPRLGVVWDPSGSGRSKIFGSYGKFFLPVASNTNVRMAGVEFFDRAYYLYSGGIQADGSPGSLGEQLSYTLISPGVVLDPRTNKDSELDPMSQDELILGFEQSVGDNWMVGIRGVGRVFGKVMEDITIDEALWEKYGVECFNPNSDEFGSCAHEYRLTNPGTTFTGFYDVNGDGELDPIEFTADELRYPEPERTYYAVELTFRRRFAENWTFFGSYTWSHSYGNYEGYVNSDIGQDDAGITQTFDFAGFNDHSYGNLPNDRRHSVKLFGSYMFDFGLQLGGSAYYWTGRPINGFGVHPTDPWAAQYGAFSFYKFGEPCPRGCGGTGESIYGLDLMAKFDFNLGPVVADLRLDVFNALDSQGVTQVDEFAEYSSSAPNPNYLDPLAYQTGRRVRVGIGFTF